MHPFSFGYHSSGSGGVEAKGSPAQARVARAVIIRQLNSNLDLRSYENAFSAVESSVTINNLQTGPMEKIISNIGQYHFRDTL